MENKQFKIVSVNISEKKGVVKKPVGEARITMEGLEGDAHAGPWHRQVSLLAWERIEEAARSANTTFSYGTYAENLTTFGIDLRTVNVFDKLVNDTIELEVTQIGKRCHAKCAIAKQVGSCIMPVEGIFARVVKPGMIKAGDSLRHVPKIFKVKIITLSDRSSSGLYEDRSGPIISQRIKDFMIEHNFKHEVSRIVIPDDGEIFRKNILDAVQNHYDIIFSTGSTGIGSRDIAPDTVLPLLNKEIPGIMDYIRLKYGAANPNALTSRAIAGVKNKTLIFTLPGSTKAVKEYMDEILPLLRHLILMVNDIPMH